MQSLGLTGEELEIDVCSVANFLQFSVIFPMCETPPKPAAVCDLQSTYGVDAAPCSASKLDRLERANNRNTFYYFNAVIMAIN